MLESIKSPSDLKALSLEQLAQLSEEIRQFLITQVSKTGGHLGPNLGVVELTIAIHRIFALGRTVGWIAHAIEQYQLDRLIRPRARYVGLQPSAVPS